MKQHITPDQLSELSEKGKVKLRGWFWKDSTDDSWYGDPDECLLLSIGQMIEFLDENKKNCWHIEREAKIRELPRVWNMYDLGAYQKKDKYFVNQVEELCDALWEAVKEVLENGKR